MTGDKITTLQRVHQNGFSILMALFILVVVSMLGVAMINSLNRGQESVAREVVSLRALLAAESGVELGLHCTLENTDASCCVGNGVFAPIVGLNPFNYTGAGLANCRASVSCRAVNIKGIDYYTLRSEGICEAGAAVDSAHRIVEVQAHETIP